MREHPYHFRTQTNREQYVAYGSWNALKRVQEWNTNAVMNLYDRLYYDRLSPEEKLIADATRSVVEQRANALGWAATGVEAIVFGIGVYRGFQKLKQLGARGSGSPEASLPDTPPEDFARLALQRDENGRSLVGEMARILNPDRTVHPEGPVLKFPGTLIPASWHVEKKIGEHKPFYAFLLKRCDNDTVLAKALFVAALAHAFVPVVNMDPSVRDGLGFISMALLHGRSDPVLHREMARLLPHKGYPLRPYNEWDAYRKPALLLQSRFVDWGDKWRPNQSPSMAYNWLARFQFPLTHIWRGVPIDDPYAEDAARALSLVHGHINWQQKRALYIPTRMPGVGGAGNVPPDQFWR